MTTAHQFIAAAFCLYGLLFLLHIDSVNSLRCKTCRFTDPDCNCGNVSSEIECTPNASCSLIRLFSPRKQGEDSTIRGCTMEGEQSYCLPLLGSWRQCFLYCSTDYCNNLPNLGSE